MPLLFLETYCHPEGAVGHEVIDQDGNGNASGRNTRIIAGNHDHVFDQVIDDRLRVDQARGIWSSRRPCTLRHGEVLIQLDFPSLEGLKLDKRSSAWSERRARYGFPHRWCISTWPPGNQVAADDLAASGEGVGRIGKNQRELRTGMVFE